MLDRFDLALMNLLQRNAGRTAYSLAEHVPLSPSAIARRLRRLRSEGWIARTIALLGPKLTGNRLRALVFIQLNEHSDLAAKTRLQEHLRATPQVQFCFETTGAHDLLALFDCVSMTEFNELCDVLLAAPTTVRRYETSFIKREVKFAPFVNLGEES